MPLQVELVKATYIAIFEKRLELIIRCESYTRFDCVTNDDGCTSRIKSSETSLSQCLPKRSDRSDRLKRQRTSHSRKNERKLQVSFEKRKQD